jgi:drug/metabolite transporter (DMT)-like permease
VLLPLSLRLPNFWQPMSWRGGLVMAAIGLLGLLLLACLDKALEQSEVSAVTPFLLATPIGMVGLTELFGGTEGAIHLFWGSLVIVSSLLSLFIYYKQRNPVVALPTSRSRQGTQ